MAEKTQGPMCSTTCGPGWIDNGTLCLSKSYQSGPTTQKTGTEPFRVSLVFGIQRWDKIPFEQAAKMVEAYLKAEQKACKRLVKQINSDQWITSFWSELLGGAKPPAYEEWVKPTATLDSARSAYRARKYSTAKSKLGIAINQYNDVHKSWVTYRDRLDKGARQSISGIEWSIVILSSAISVGVGGKIVAKGASMGARALAAGKSATLSASLSGYATAYQQIGLVSQGVEKKIDVGKIVLETAVSFTTSLISGALSKKFLPLLQPRIEQAVGKAFLPTFTQKMISDFLTGAGTNIVAEAVKSAAAKSKGKSLSMSQFIDLVVKEIKKESITTAWKAYFKNRK